MAAAKAGVGLVKLLSHQVTDAITEDSLRPVLEDFAPLA